MTYPNVGGNKRLNRGEESVSNGLSYSDDNSESEVKKSIMQH